VPGRYPANAPSRTQSASWKIAHRLEDVANFDFYSKNFRSEDHMLFGKFEVLTAVTTKIIVLWDVAAN
jgi:hypothetical protein